MHVIFHFLVVNTKTETVLRAVSTIEGVSEWWTESVTGNCYEGGTFSVGFAHGFSFEMEVINITQTETAWKCKKGPEQWINTTIVFQVQSNNDGTTSVKFTHSGWKQMEDFFGECNFQWALFLKSLRLYCETGKGLPFRLQSND